MNTNENATFLQSVEEQQNPPNAEVTSTTTTYYYAYYGSDYIVTWVGAVPTPITGEGYVQITESQYTDGDLVGKRYDPDTNSFVDPWLFSCNTYEVQYKTTDSNLQSVLEEMMADIEDAASSAGTPGPAGADGADGADGKSAYQIAVDNGFNGTEAQWLASLKGDKGDTGDTGAAGAAGEDGQDGTTVVVGTTTTGAAGTEAQVSGSLNSDTNTLTLNFTIPRGANGESGSSASVTAEEVLTKIKTVDGANSGLDADLLDGNEASHFATAEALADGLAGKAPTSHTHTEYAPTEHTHSGYATTDHTHTGYATADHTHTGYATADHTHTGYAASNHTHTASEVGAASSSHTHTPSSIGAAASNHTHSGYATTGHTHSDYLSTDGGTVNGDLNVNGIIKANGQQAFYYSGSSQTVGTNNATGGTTIACGANANAVVNGANLMAANVLPRNNGSFTLGDSSYRWTGIYSKANVNVSSDERLKNNIVDVDAQKCVDFVDKITVKNFNYITDNKKRIGVIAQELIASDPVFSKYFVEKDESGYYGVKTSDLVFPLLVAYQELKKQVEELKR